MMENRSQFVAVFFKYSVPSVLYCRRMVKGSSYFLFSAEMKRRVESVHIGEQKKRTSALSFYMEERLGEEVELYPTVT